MILTLVSSALCWTVHLMAPVTFLESCSDAKIEDHLCWLTFLSYLPLHKVQCYSPDFLLSDLYFQHIGV